MGETQTNLPLDLHDAYLKTTYRVSTDTGVINIRIGERQPSLDELLEAAGAASWAFITAFNPHSTPVSDAQNIMRQADLRRHVIGAGYPVHDAMGEPDGGDWLPEDSLLILGMTRADAIGLGRRFHQNAIVFGYRNEVARLLSCLPDP